MTDREIALDELVTTANGYRRRWLRDKNSYSETAIQMAKCRAITRFVECLSSCEDRGGNVSEALRFLLDYVSTRESPTDWGLLEEGLVCDTHGVLFLNDPSFSDKTPAGRVSDKQRYSVKPDGSIRARFRMFNLFVWIAKCSPNPVWSPILSRLYNAFFEDIWVVLS